MGTAMVASIREAAAFKVVTNAEETNQCTADDATKTSTTAFSCAAITCAKKSFFRLDATSKCIADLSKISTGCSNCFGQVAQCTLKNCAVQCLVDPTSSTCQTCGHSHCDDLAKSCSGLTTLPPNPTGCNKVAAATTAVVASIREAAAETGQCTADDATKTNTAAFSCAAITCAKKNFFRLDATSKCIADLSKISTGCSNCFGQVAQCTLKNCAVQCLVDPTSSTCQTCGHSHCDDL